MFGKGSQVAWLVLFLDLYINLVYIYINVSSIKRLQEKNESRFFFGSFNYSSELGLIKHSSKKTSWRLAHLEDWKP